jgi:hypothetical protein
MVVSIGAGLKGTSRRLRNTRDCIFARVKVEEVRRPEKAREKAGRAGATNTNAPLTKIARMRCNDGCKRSYPFLIPGATYQVHAVSGSYPS